MTPHQSVHLLARILQVVVLLVLFVAVASLAQLTGPAPAYDAITIAQPTEGSTVFDNEGNVAVQILMTPVAVLRPGDRVLVNFDGQVLENAGLGSFTLRGVTRGEHTLQAAVVDADGNQVRISPLVRFNVWQASRLFPNRQ